MAKPKKKPWLAGLLSFLVIGMGQVYNREYKKGILLFMLVVAFSILGLTNYWWTLVGILIVIYAIYDAYKTAKKTISEKPYENAVWIAVIILILVFVASFVSGFLYGVIEQVKLEKYKGIRQILSTQLDKFNNKHNEALLSFKAGDTFTARTKISEAKGLLTYLKRDFEFVCSFEENNRNLLGITDLDIKKCKAFLELYSFCFPKYLDSFYNLTYLSEQAKQIETQEDVDAYKKSCYSWLSDYNVIRESCNTIIEINKLDIEPFEDFSKMCEI